MCEYRGIQERQKDGEGEEEDQFAGSCNARILHRE